MPHNNPVVAALPIGNSPGNNADKTLLRNMLVQRTAYVVDNAADAADLIAVDPATGVIILVIICLGRNYLYDPTDTTSAHDGVSVLVTSDGKRYKLSTGLDVVVYSALDRLGTPPATSPLPPIGASYLVTVGATGAWAGHDNQIAVMTSRGWEFIIPGIGRLVYVEDEDAYYRKKPDGTMSIGLGTSAVAAGSILPSHLQGGGDHIVWSVVNQTTNTPPAVINGVQYIIGPAPTGAWAGHPGKIAHGEAGVWVIYTPINGWLAFDQALNEFYRFSGSAWITSTGRMQLNTTVFTAGGTFSKNARCVFVEVYVISGGGGGNQAGGATAGGSSSFGAHASCTGGAAGNGATGAAGVATGSDLAISKVNGVAALETARGMTACKYGLFWGGMDADIGGPTYGAGGVPAIAYKRILVASLGASETVTVGAAGSGAGGENGSAGLVVVDEWVLT